MHPMQPAKKSRQPAMHPDLLFWSSLSSSPSPLVPSASSCTRSGWSLSSLRISASLSAADGAGGVDGAGGADEVDGAGGADGVDGAGGADEVDGAGGADVTDGGIGGGGGGVSGTFMRWWTSTGATSPSSRVKF